MKLKELQCQKCKEVSSVKKEHTFLGFLKMICPKCQHKNVYPLSAAMRNFYVILVLSVFVLPFLGFTPGWLFGAAIIALISDGSIRKKIELASANNLSVNNTDSFSKKINIETFCHNCGNALDGEIRFCSKCGTKK